MDNKEVLKDQDLENLTFNTNQQLGFVLVEFFKTLLKRKWLILTCLFIIVVPVTIWTLKQIPIYRTKVMIMYDEPRDTMFALDVGQPFYNKSAIVNMIELIKSQSIADQVARALPEEVKKTYKLPDPLPKSFSLEKYIAGIIRENLLITAVRGSDLINIFVEASDPVAAKIIADTYVDKLIEWNLKNKKEEISNISNFVEGQLSVFQDRLKASEDNLLDFKEQNKMISLSEASKDVLAALTEAEVNYNEAKTEREALEQRWRYIEQKKRDLTPSLIVTTSETTQRLKQELAKLEIQYSSLVLQATPADQVKLSLLREKINQTKQDLTNELMGNTVRENLIDPLSQIRTLLQESITIEVDLETYKAREQGLKRIIDSYNEQMQTLPKKELELARYIRAKDVNDKIYGLLLEKREEARITEASKVGDVRLIDPAEQPFAPIKPNKKKNIIMGFVVGLALGIGLALFLESADVSVKTEDDIEKKIKLPLLASIPSFNTNGILSICMKGKHTKEAYEKKILTDFTEVPHLFEAYQTLHLNLSFASPDNQLQSILVTSSLAGEGKTLTTINMAQMFARNGVRTLLIDCDLRRPMIHKILDLAQEPGLINILIKKEDLSQTIQQSTDPNLSILTCGTLPPNPSEILNSNRMKEFLELVKTDYDMVIWDTTPVIPVTDAIILGSKIDGVCLVIKSGKTARDVVIRAKKKLEKSGSKIIGIILNNVNLKNTYGYYKDYYYYSTKDKKKKSIRSGTKS